MPTTASAAACFTSAAEGFQSFVLSSFFSASFFFLFGISTVQVPMRGGDWDPLRLVSGEYLHAHYGTVRRHCLTLANRVWVA